jgi:hypothetical protein
MTNQPVVSVENNFTKGFVTEFTGLNFPENAATDTDNCTYGLVGDVTRRGGFNFELNHVLASISHTDKAMSSYKWNNAGGDGLTQLLVEQVGSTLYFYRSSSATVASPLSTQILSSTIDLNSFGIIGRVFDPALECQFSDGNGYLFIYHPSCDPIYCTYIGGTIAGNRITVQIRDFTGVNEFGVSVNTRPTSLTVQHNYNLINQGWVAGNPWSTSSTTSNVIGLGSKTFSVDSGLSVTLGVQVTIIGIVPVGGGPPGGSPSGALMSGNVTAYAGTTMTINVTSGATGWFGTTGSNWSIVPRDTAYISTWNTAIGNYPSNADVWWSFKNSSGAFAPATTLANTSLSSGPAPKGHIVLDAFNQQRDVLSGLSVTDVITTSRPRTGTWFQGRVWYSGVDAQQAATGDAQFTTWTENIYFSQVITSPSQFGQCYQVNDPTSETLFNLLPTDGGVVTIQGCGSIYKLFPIQNGLLVFAANGVWFITGSQGIGFTANDYTIIPLSQVKSISGTSFVNVLGLPYFWNEEGIYAVQPQQGGSLTVAIQTYRTIDTFYSDIPLSSKKYARGDYDPINYTIQWIYRDTEAVGITERYKFNKILNYLVNNQAFFPYTIGTVTNSINGINYITHPGGSNAPGPRFKYYCGTSASTSFAEENDFETYLDWANENYTSYFVTGYKLHGQAQRKIQLPYIYVFSRNDESTSYKIQGLWDYANSRNSGRWSTLQIVENFNPKFGMLFRRHRIRGQGLVLQIKIQSVDGEPFDIMGWSTFETANTSP